MPELMTPPVQMPAFDYTPRSRTRAPAGTRCSPPGGSTPTPRSSRSTASPLMIVEGNMQYLFDETGRRYLDLFAGIVTVSCGHCHPKVVARVKEQVETLQHTTTIYLHPNMPRLAEKLASKMPPGLDVTYFVNSGSEANDLADHHGPALHRAHRRDRAPERLSRRIAVGDGPDLAPHLEASRPSRAPTSTTRSVPSPTAARSGGTPEEIAAPARRDIGELIRYSTPGRIAAFIAEPIQGVGGVTSGAPNYFREAYRIAREHGGLCIADEVQTGFGRTGEHYWGFENFGVVPDIVTMAKGFGNGVPLAAVTTRREIAEVLAQRLHFNTFGGNPVSMAAGLAVMEVIDEEGLQRERAGGGTPVPRGSRAARGRAPADRRRAGDGSHARRRAGHRSDHPRPGHGADGSGAGGVPLDGRVDRQGRDSAGTCSESSRRCASRPPTWTSPSTCWTARLPG